MSADPGRAIADEVFYEGYVLWPYRHATAKEGRGPRFTRFTLGRAFPRGCPEGPDRLHTECLIEGDDPTVEATVRFLHLVERQALDAHGEAVDELVVAGASYRSQAEAIEREVRIPSLPNRTATIATAGEERQVLTESGAVAGALVWRWETLHGTVEAWVDEVEPGLRRVRVEVANRLEWNGGDREETLRQTLCSTHAIMHSPDGAFIPLADPTAELREAATACRNEGLWPVPIGEAGDRRTVLASPIVLDALGGEERIRITDQRRRAQA